MSGEVTSPCPALPDPADGPHIWLIINMAQLHYSAVAESQDRKSTERFLHSSPQPITVSEKDQHLMQLTESSIRNMTYEMDIWSLNRFPSTKDAEERWMKSGYLPA